MIDHGADPKVKVPKEFDWSGLADGTGRRTDTLVALFEAIFGHDKATHLRVRMDEVARRNRSQKSILWKAFGWR
jgi:hypothetical protein